MIALLRASNIPARYAYGTVQIPVEQVMNWVGGVEVPQAALSILGQGGIPATGITQGGRFTHVKLEHIWVEAWVDFEPSRGAKNIQGDSWIPLDASFKQYDYTDGLDITQQVPFDAESFAETLINSATIDETTGSVKNIDQQFIQSQLTQYQQRVEQFIKTQDPDMTVGEVLGTKTIRQMNVPILEAGLPYEELTTGNRFAGIPDSLRHKYRFQLQNQYGSTLFTRTLDLPTLAGKTLALSFRPATSTDEQTLQRYIPENITDISQLPQSLPGYLINLEAELVIDNQETLTGARMTMGTEVTLNQALYSPRSGWDSTNTFIIAGEYHAIGVSASGISKKRLEGLKNESETAQIIFEDCKDKNICEPILNLNKHQITGNILQAGVLSWFAITESQDQFSARSQKVITYNLPSYGKFGTSAKVQYSWGVARNVTFRGAILDIDFRKIIASSPVNDKQTAANFVRISGIRASANEHIVPERMFSMVGSPARGISAVKALELAAAGGQRIFNLNQGNSSQINNIILESNIRTEILDALDSGREIIVHEHPINMLGWTGSGYIIIDPETGSGAYKISGGSNGGFLENYPSSFVSISLFGIGLLAGLVTGGLAPVLVFIVLSLVIFNAFITFMIGDIELKDNGCPEALSDLLMWITIATLLLPRFLSARLFSMVMSLVSFVNKNTITASAPACGGL